MKPLIFFEELFYFDVPILIHAKDEGGLDYLVYFFEFTDLGYKTLTFKVEKPDFFDYVHRKITLLQLIKKNEGNCFIENFLNDGSVEMTTTKKIPDKYLPSEESYFYEEISETYLNFFND